MALLCTIYFFFSVTANTEIYTLSLHDALPISFDELGGGNNPYYSYGARLTIPLSNVGPRNQYKASKAALQQIVTQLGDRKSTRLNSSHVRISYAVFCLKKKTLGISTSRSVSKR